MNANICSSCKHNLKPEMPYVKWSKYGDLCMTCFNLIADEIYEEGQKAELGDLYQSPDN